MMAIAVYLSVALVLVAAGCVAAGYRRAAGDDRWNDFFYIGVVLGIFWIAAVTVLPIYGAYRLLRFVGERAHARRAARLKAKEKAGYWLDLAEREEERRVRQEAEAEVEAFLRKNT